LTLKAVFGQHPPHNSNEAAERIEELTGIRLSPGRVRKFLHRLGMAVRKTGHVPAKAKLGIHLVLLPPYSLNLIERLWKFVKKKVLYAQYYSTVEKFHHAVRNGMYRVNTDSMWKAELKTLLAPKFQLFEAPVAC